MEKCNWVMCYAFFSGICIQLCIVTNLILHFYQQCIRVTFPTILLSPYPYQGLLVVVYLMESIMIGVRWTLHVVFNLVVFGLVLLDILTSILWLLFYGYLYSKMCFLVTIDRSCFFISILYLLFVNWDYIQSVIEKYLLIPLIVSKVFLGLLFVVSFSPVVILKCCWFTVLGDVFPFSSHLFI